MPSENDIYDMIFTPFGGDYSKYGQTGGEHNFFPRAPAAPVTPPDAGALAPMAAATTTPAIGALQNYGAGSTQADRDETSRPGFGSGIMGGSETDAVGVNDNAAPTSGSIDPFGRTAADGTELGPDWGSIGNNVLQGALTAALPGYGLARGAIGLSNEIDARDMYGLPDLGFWGGLGAMFGTEAGSIGRNAKAGYFGPTTDFAKGEDRGGGGGGGGDDTGGVGGGGGNVAPGGRGPGSYGRSGDATAGWW